MFLLYFLINSLQNLFKDEDRVSEEPETGRLHFLMFGDHTFKNIPSMPASEQEVGNTPACVCVFLVLIVECLSSLSLTGNTQVQRVFTHSLNQIDAGPVTSWTQKHWTVVSLMSGLVLVGLGLGSCLHVLGRTLNGLNHVARWVGTGLIRHAAEQHFQSEQSEPEPPQGCRRGPDGSIHTSTDALYCTKHPRLTVCF